MVFIEKMQWSSGDDAPTEDITFRYGAIQFSYTPQTAGGTSGTQVQTTWSQILNDQEFAVQ